jgi:nitrate reductase assembly molybdenum cofactor insertion protein NarJ
MQSPAKQGSDKVNTWANLLSANGMESNDLFKKLVVEAEQADADDYQAHYAEMLTLKKMIDMTKTQETVSDELTLWKNDLLEMGNLQTRVLSS